LWLHGDNVFFLLLLRHDPRTLLVLLSSSECFPLDSYSLTPDWPATGHETLMGAPNVPQAQTVFSSQLQSPFTGSGTYLSATSHFFQPACGDSEGWGPLSPTRYDFTPCFLDVWTAAVAGFGIILGSGAIWYLIKRCTPQPVRKNWHFYAKLVGCGHSLGIERVADGWNRLFSGLLSLRRLFRELCRLRFLAVSSLVTFASGLPS